MPRLPILVALLIAALNSGCAGVFRRELPVESAPAPEPQEMSAADRNRAFKEAHGRGLKLAGQGETGLALGAFERAVMLRPDSLEALFNLGACHEALGDPMRAITIYRRILRINPDDSDCYHNLGTSYIKLHYRENSPIWRKLARKAWRRSLELNPDQPDLKAFLAASDSID